MHGRLKVRTSEEEKRIKELERKKKLGFYRTTMATIMEKRKKKKLDGELMSLTSQLLIGNPDIYTLWNIRRETLILLKSEFADDAVAMSKLYNTELQLTENCLRVNPKSYCAWHHRVWVLENRMDADWKKELELCNLYLKLDERNFHTWDYRRYVISKFDTSLEDEFNYTTEKIQENFSNYSAWHYRSKILVKLHPDIDGGRPIEGTRHKEELEMVLSAAFTDPNDTSAWFYQRWLLGAVKKVTKIALCKVTPTIAYVAFNNGTSHTDVDKNLSIYVNGDKIVAGTWMSCRHKSHDVLWILKYDTKTFIDDTEIQISYTNENEKQVVKCEKHDLDEYFAFEKANFIRHYAEPVVEELNKQLECCQQLLELEPDNKWTMLATTVLSHCLDSKKNQLNSLSMIEKLKKVDSMRSSYYDDLASLWKIEKYLQNKDNFIRMCDINQIHQQDRDIKLSSLFHLQYWSVCTEVDFSKQKLTSKSLASLVVLQNCKILKLCDNNITSMKQFPILPQLEALYLQGNSIDEEEINLLKERMISVRVY